MGYYIFSIGVEWNKLEKALGSSDHTLLEEVMNTEIFDNYADQDFPGTVKTGQALEQLIFGKPYQTDSPHSYWYAFIALCDHLGMAFSGTHEIQLGHETNLINRHLENDFDIKTNIEETLLNMESVPGLPEVADFPMHGVLDKPRLQQLQLLLSKVVITDELLEQLQEEDEEKEMVYDSIREIKESVTYCLDNGMVLFSFCH